VITEQQKKIYTTHVCDGVSFDELVKKANEIYFDIEPEMYDEKHPEIKKFEADRWNGLAKKYFTSNRSLRVLDIGCGSGFVADHVCNNLKKEDTFVFTDISKEMLDYCENHFRDKFKCRLEFKTINSETLGFPDDCFDIVTLNSVLHHIPDTKKILQEINRVLKTEGILIIAHEVNSAFFKHKILWTNYKIIRIFSNRRMFLESLFNHLGLINLYTRYFKSNEVSYYEMLYEKVNEELINQKFICKPLSPSKMGLIMELYSSTGFDIDNLAKHTSNLVLIEKKTYNHLNDNPTILLLKLYEKILSVLFPNSGKSFVAVFQKSLN
jgi:ubiquinone/menaquinone biosynthesis C-methylase UbiE